MTKHRQRVAVLLLCGVVLFGLVITYLHIRPPLLYHLQVVRWHELPTRLIRPAFQHIVNRDLPANTKALRALFQGGSEPKIFVTYETDSDGITFINETFARSGAEWEIFDANDQRFELHSN